MTSVQTTAVAVAGFAVAAQVLTDTGMPEVWAALFWISAMGNAVLLMLWHEAREKARRRAGTM